MATFSAVALSMPVGSLLHAALPRLGRRSGDRAVVLSPRDLLRAAGVALLRLRLRERLLLELRDHLGRDAFEARVGADREVDVLVEELLALGLRDLAACALRLLLLRGLRVLLAAALAAAAACRGAAAARAARTRGAAPPEGSPPIGVVSGCVGSSAGADVVFGLPSDARRCSDAEFAATPSSFLFATIIFGSGPPQAGERRRADGSDDARAVRVFERSTLSAYHRGARVGHSPSPW